VGFYLLKRLANYAILLVVAINVSWLLAATQLNPRSLYEVANPPIDPVSIENNLRSRNLSDQVPLFERWQVWSSSIVFYWDWGQSPRGGNVGEEIDRRIWVSVRLITLILGAAFFSRIQRNVMLDSLGSGFVRTARAKGLKRSQAITRHALRVSLIPTCTYFAFSVATLFVGAAFMEIIFSFHGMGDYGIQTIQGQDVHGAVATAAFGGLCVLFGALLADVMVAWLDPRVRMGSAVHGA